MFEIRMMSDTNACHHAAVPKATLSIECTSQYKVATQHAPVLCILHSCRVAFPKLSDGIQTTMFDSQRPHRNHKNGPLTCGSNLCKSLLGLGCNSKSLSNCPTFKQAQINKPSCFVMLMVLQDIVDPNLVGFVKVHHSLPLDGEFVALRDSEVARLKHARNLFQHRGSQGFH